MSEESLDPALDPCQPDHPTEWRWMTDYTLAILSTVSPCRIRYIRIADSPDTWETFDRYKKTGVAGYGHLKLPSCFFDLSVTCVLYHLYLNPSWCNPPQDSFSQLRRTLQAYHYIWPSQQMISQKSNATLDRRQERSRLLNLIIDYAMDWATPCDTSDTLESFPMQLSFSQFESSCFQSSAKSPQT